MEVVEIWPSQNNAVLPSKGKNPKSNRERREIVWRQEKQSRKVEHILALRKIGLESTKYYKFYFYIHIIFLIR